MSNEELKHAIRIAITQAIVDYANWIAMEAIRDAQAWAEIQQLEELYRWTPDNGTARNTA